MNTDKQTHGEVDMNTEIIKSFIENTVFRSKKLAEGIPTALVEVAASISGIRGSRIGVREFSLIAQSENNSIFKKLPFIPVKPGKKSAADVLIRFCSTDTARREITGVLHDAENKRIVATNDKILAFCDMPADETESVIIDKSGNKIDRKPYQYAHIIPSSFSNSREIGDIQKIIGYLNAAINFACISDTELPLFSISGVAFSAEVFSMTLKAFSDLGAKTVQFQWNSVNKIFMLKSCGLTVLLSPWRITHPCVILDIFESAFAPRNNNVNDFVVFGNTLTGGEDNPLRGFEPVAGERELALLLRSYKDELLGGCLHGTLAPLAFGGDLDVSRAAKAARKAAIGYASSETINVLTAAINVFRAIKTREDAKKSVPAVVKALNDVHNRIFAIAKKIEQTVSGSLKSGDDIEKVLVEAMRNKGVSAAEIIEIIEIIENAKLVEKCAVEAENASATDDNLQTRTKRDKECACRPSCHVQQGRVCR